jgi:DNA polymerase (family 10)
LDIDWRWVRYAREKGVMVSINPDAHHINGIDDIRYGVLVAQKALLKKEENLSSLSLSDFEQFISN